MENYRQGFARILKTNKIARFNENRIIYGLVSKYDMKKMKNLVLWVAGQIVHVAHIQM